MKKKLVVLLAVVMMFAFAASAYAVDFTDLSEQPVTVQDAVAKTTALGIIEGYSDGTFGPEQNITRAEFAKIAVTAAGAKDTAAMLEKNASTFKDVKAGQWYTGWINASESLGIFLGDGNGNFRPNDSISNQEVITVLMRLLGYNDNLTGTWPVNYVTQANKDGILDDVTIVASAAAKRADVVVMLDETLDTDIVTYDKDTNEFVKKQTTIAGSSYITLLEDSFKGTYLEIDKFDRVEQVRDAAKETLNWTVSYVTGYDEEKEVDITDSKTLIIDKDTKVSYNGGTLFDLENHQGKVYYVKDGDKYYARFIEVESYTKLVSDKPTQDGKTAKVSVGKTSYNATSKKIEITDNAKNNEKNSKFVLYFNDDDQVYRAQSDLDYLEKTYWVKSVGTNSVKLIGTQNKTANMKEDETLIWDGKEFIAPSELKVGDAVMEITADDLYVKIDEKSGKLTKEDTKSAKATIDGSAYVYGKANETMKFIDEDFEDSDATTDEVFGNTVKFILNKDNSIARVMVDETSTGTKLYGIVTDGEDKSGKWSQGDISTITIFTSEGKSVSYDFDNDCVTTGVDNSKDCIARLVEYKLNKDGEIKYIKVVDTNMLTKGDGTEEIEVKNNAYLTFANTTVTLASNAIIFEVDVDSKGKVDPAIVNRASLLSGGDFEPSSLENVNGAAAEGRGSVNAYCKYVLNSNGAVKAMAYTEAGSSNYRYAVVADALFNADGYDNAIELVGDDTIYEGADGKPAATTDDAFIVYTLSGDDLTVVDSYAKKTGIKDAGAMKLTGYSNGLMTFKEKMTVARNLDAYDENNKKYNSVQMDTIMTDGNTLVYVMNATTGKYEVGELTDFSKDSYVYVPVVDEDGYADVVLVDEYTNYNAQFTVKVEATGFDEAAKPSVDKTTVEYGETVTLTIPSAAFTAEGKTVAITVDGKEVTKPESGDYTVTTDPIKANTTIKVVRTLTDAPGA